MPTRRLSTPVSEDVLAVVQQICEEYGVRQHDLIATVFDPDMVSLTEAQVERLKEIGHERRIPPQVKRAIEVLSDLSDDDIDAILQARKSKGIENGSQDQA